MTTKTRVNKDISVYTQVTSVQYSK